jgi:hypothetical protein
MNDVIMNIILSIHIKQKIQIKVASNDTSINLAAENKIE